MASFMKGFENDASRMKPVISHMGFLEYIDNFDRLKKDSENILLHLKLCLAQKALSLKMPHAEK